MPEDAAVRRAHVAELGGEHDLVAPVRGWRGRPAPRCVTAPYMSAVSRKRDAELERAVDGGDRLRLVAAGRRTRDMPMQPRPKSLSGNIMRDCKAFAA